MFWVGFVLFVVFLLLFVSWMSGDFSPCERCGSYLTGVEHKASDNCWIILKKCYRCGFLEVLKSESFEP